MSLKSTLPDLITYMQEQFLTFGSSLTDAERAQVGAADAWAARDVVFHSLVWAERFMDDLETFEGGADWPKHDFGTDDEANDVIFHENEHRSWDEAEAFARSIYARAAAYLDRTDEATLLVVPGGQNQTIWRNIAGNFIMHPMIHLWEYWREHGHLDTLAAAFGDSFTERLLAVHDSDHWRALTFYNQACIFAQAGKTADAIRRLAEALDLNPGLTEWSRHDPDLISLRGEPAFQALYPHFEMQPGAMTAYDLFGGHWKEVRGGLMAALNQLSDEQLRFVPREGMRSLGEVVCHIASAEEGWFRHAVRRELDRWPEDFTPENYPTVEAVKTLLTEVHDRTMAYLKTVDAADLVKPTKLAWGQELSLNWVTWHVLEHEIHHRGELFLMLGLLGMEAPDI